MSRRKERPYDGEVRRLSALGMTNQAIADAIGNGVTLRMVADARMRMGLTKRLASYEKPIRYKKKEKIERACPGCGRKHMTDPVVWFCAACTEKNNGIDTSCWN